MTNSHALFLQFYQRKKTDKMLKMAMTLVGDYYDYADHTD